MRLTGGRGHLSYCTNIHPGESWADCFGALRQHLPEIKLLVSPDAPFGVGLRLSARAAAELELHRFREFLAAEDLYVFTLNGFPYGAFHRTRVKTQVYRPDWRRRERLDYTIRLADLLAELLPPGEDGSISTVPGAWAADLVGEGDIEAIVAMLVRAAAHLDAIHHRTGKLITLALEPEPGCLLDSTADAVPLFRRLRAVAGDRLVDRYLGLCLDLCHLAVGFEDPANSLALLRAEAIPVRKLQVSAGLRLAPADADALAPFDDGIYLHQVAARGGGRIERFPDLAEALASPAAAGAEEWRVHFHVPLWADGLGRLASTADITAQALALHAAAPVCPHLEVETYTWDVLPEHHRRCGLAPAIVRELQWVLQQLG